MNTPAREHLDDGALVRILDGQSLPNDDIDHLPGCEDCHARYDVIRRRSRALHDLLERARPAEPTPPSDLRERVSATSRDRGDASWLRSRLLRAAAIATTLLAGALAAEPVREWVGEAVRELAVGLGAADRPARPGRGEVGAGVELTIAITGDRVALRFDAAEPGGIARITFRDAPEASGRLPDDPTAPDLVALSDGFRVRNAGARGTLYRFTTPAGVPVEVRVDGRLVETLEGESGERREIGLGAD